MRELYLNVIPLILLLILGYWMRRTKYFADEVVKNLTRFIGDVLLPCVIFNSVVNLKIRMEHLYVSLGFFALLCVFLIVSFLTYRILHLKRKFFIFFSSAFAFGLMGIPMFSAIFGAENMEYLVAMGVGHELFFAIVYVTVSRMALKGDSWSMKGMIRNLISPMFGMVVLALVMNLTGWKDQAAETLIGLCFLETVVKLASVTTVLTMIVVGYRIHFENKTLIRESILCVLYRYGMVFVIAAAAKILFFQRIVSSIYFDHAYVTMLCSFGSTMLVVFVGEYGDREDMEVSSNAFVLNVLTAIVIYMIYILWVG